MTRCHGLFDALEHLSGGHVGRYHNMHLSHSAKRLTLQTILNVGLLAGSRSKQAWPNLTREGSVAFGSNSN